MGRGHKVLLAEWVSATKFGQLHGVTANQLWRLTYAGALTAVSDSDTQPAD